MKELAEYIMRNLVEFPEELCVKELSGESLLILEVKLAKNDIGKIIGKQGKTINAIRTLLQSIASKNNMRVQLQILE